MATIAEIVAQSGSGFDENNQDFDILLSAVQTAGLVEALNDPTADLTVFAPTDAAFIQLAQDLGFRGVDEAGAFGAIADTLTALGGGDPVPLLTDILLYHVSPGAQTQEQLQTSGSVTTLLSEASFAVAGNELIDAEPDIENPRFIPALANVPAANGTVQGIDRVLLPLDLPDNDRRVITGSSDTDFLFGLSRDTIFLAKGGDDFVFGGVGDDQLNGDAGDDVLFGNSGSDILRGDEGDDRLYGGSQADLLLGGDGDDILYGNGGDDTLIGGAGNDRLYGNSGQDLLDGGLGDDELYLNGGEDTVVLRRGEGLDQIFGFQPNQVTFALDEGLTFADLSFQQGDGFSELRADGQVLAKVIGVSVGSLSLEASFVEI